jgi:hypothetical protein
MKPCVISDTAKMKRLGPFSNLKASVWDRSQCAVKRELDGGVSVPKREQSAGTSS